MQTAPPKVKQFPFYIGAYRAKGRLAPSFCVKLRCLAPLFAELGVRTAASAIVEASYSRDMAVYAFRQRSTAIRME